MALPTRRAVMSAAEPGGKPMIRWIGRDGKSPARPCGTAATAVSASVSPNTAMRCMAVLPLDAALFLNGPIAAKPAVLRLLPASGEATLIDCGTRGDAAY